MTGWYRKIKAYCTTADLVLIAVIWAAAIAATAAILTVTVKAEEVRVEANGQLVGVWDASVDRFVTVQGARGPVQLHIHDGGVEIVKVNCPLQICKNTGRITRTGMVIVCIPNRLVIYLSGPPDPAAPLITQ